jgi:hypothetical protein
MEGYSTARHGDFRGDEVSSLDISSSPSQRWLAKEFASSLETSHRTIRTDVHGYVELARHLGESPGPEPDPDFRAALRHRLLHELIEDDLLPRSDELAVRRDRVRRKGGSHCFERAPREPWIAAASTVLVVCGGAVGLGQDSSEALPGDVLYPVKRFFEAGEMALAGSADGEARELMEQATERLEEAQALAGDDEIHAQQALPATIVDFNEATSEAGSIIVEQAQADAVDPALLSDFESFSSASWTVLDELATVADPETVALIENARSTLDGFADLLPILDPVLAGTEDLPIAAATMNALDLSGDEHGDGSTGTPVDAPSSDSIVPAAEDDRPDAPVINVEETLGPITDTVTNPVEDTVENASATLGHTVQVIELSADKTVSVALATVHNTVKTVDQTVQQTAEAVDQTLDQAAETVDQTVQQATEAVDQTLDAVDETVQLTTDSLQQATGQATETLQQAADSLQQATGQATETLQQATDSLQQATDSVDQTLQDAGALQDVADDTLSSLQNATSGGLLSAPSGD